MKRLLTVSILIFIFAGCEPGTMGPCVHIYEDPVLTISSVTAGKNGESISQITITDVQVDGAAQSPDQLTGEVSENISVDDSAIVCTVPCGFGTLEGSYEFTVSADGYRDSEAMTQASYSTNEGGCPSRSADGSAIEITFTGES